MAPDTPNARSASAKPRPRRSSISLAVFVAVAVAGAAVMPAPSVAADKPLAVDTVAPDFTLPDHQGKPFRLSEALARRDFVVVAFFVKAFTGG